MCALCLSGAYIFSSFEQRGVLISRLKMVQAFFHQSFIGLSFP
jgi:hypothetical protein